MPSVITVVEPKEYVAMLWGKQEVKNTKQYRLMRYVLRVDYDGKVLLHNVVTGQLVILDEEEVSIVDNLPSDYRQVLKLLVNDHYLVPQDYDEHQQVINLRMILHKFDITKASQQKAISRYTILPTTACNARCYYCYEKDVPVFTMTEKIADDTVKFILNNSNSEKKVSIRWFGGEPTIASQRIDQICKGLADNGIQYYSTMTTNGYLFDEEMVTRAITIWNLKSVMVCLDGTEKNYNDIKAYVNVKDNPYQRVLRNISLLLDSGIEVELRMNFDIGNFQDFEGILDEVNNRFHKNKLLQVHAFPVKGEYPDRNGKIQHGSVRWFDEKIVELNDLARDSGVFQRVIDLPSLFFSTCSAGCPWFMVVMPNGELTRCVGEFESNQVVGNVNKGITDKDYYQSWTEFSDIASCRECVLFPSCIIIERCPGKGKCFLKETFRQSEEMIKHVVDSWLVKNSL